MTAKKILGMVLIAIAFVTVVWYIFLMFANPDMTPMRLFITYWYIYVILVVCASIGVSFAGIYERTKHNGEEKRDSRNDRRKLFYNRVYNHRSVDDSGGDNEMTKLEETLHKQLDWLTIKHIDADGVIRNILIEFNKELQPLKKALAEAIFNRNIVTEKCTEYDPAGSTYEYDWTDKMKEWAKLADVDLSKKDPASYSNRR